MASLRDIVDSSTIFRVMGVVKRDWGLNTRAVFLGTEKVFPRESWCVSGIPSWLKSDAEGPLEGVTEGAVSSLWKGVDL
jgi:hypothetical protein